MTEVNSLLIMVLSEILLVTTIISVGMIAYKVVKRGRERSAIHKLIVRVKEDAPRRLNETRKLMTEQYGFDGKDLEEISAKISRDEKVFYQSVINTYLRRDADAMQNLHVDFEVAVETYRSLEFPQREAPAILTSDPGNKDEIERLTVENQRLAEELQITMDTMGRMLGEYSSMFGGGADSELDKIKMIKMLSDDKDAEATALDTESSAQDQAPEADDVVDSTLDLAESSQADTPAGTAEPLDDALDMVALTDDDLSDIADMDQTIVMDAGLEEMDEADIDALIGAHSPPKRTD